MRRSTSLTLTVLLGILLGFFAGGLAARASLQRRLTPANTYQRLYLHLQETEKILAQSATSGSEEKVRTALFQISTRLAEAHGMAYGLQVELSTLYNEPETRLPYRIRELSEAANALVKVQLSGRQVSRDDLESLHMAFSRLLDEVPDPNGTDLAVTRSGLRSLAPSDPSLVPLINKGQ